MKICLITLLLLFGALRSQAAGPAQFQFRDLNATSLELSDNNKPVFVYNYGPTLKPGVPEDRARCCYLHPVYAPNGVVITDDFPRDHYHHRGISWMWPIVTVDGHAYDLWMLHGIADKFEKWTRKEAAADRAVLAFEDGWYIGGRKVVSEDVQITAHPESGGRRDLDFDLRFLAIGRDVQIEGTHEHEKGYGGFNIRFAPRTGTIIRTDSGEVPDSDMKPQPWAELTGSFNGKTAGARITIDPSNTGYPNGWCLRHYGFLGVNMPGLQPYTIGSAKPLVLKFRVSILAGPSESSAKPKVLVYTRNFVTNGKGYVHDNIQTSIGTIRQLGAENGFDVDASDDPNMFTDANLKQYAAVVFANSNNEAFDSQLQRDSFQRYIRAGGGFVGIHSASGSERAWPYFWSVLGGKFVRHPKMQSFEVRVAGARDPVTKGLPPSFDWRDECYYFEHITPDVHVLLSTDPAKIADPQGVTGERIGGSLPLAWRHTFDGGREFYTALGHNKEDYANPLLRTQILNGILWVMKKTR